MISSRLIKFSMASILRSGKFVRYFASLTRSFAFNSLRESEGSFVQNTQCICSSFTQGFATAAPKLDHNLERSLKRLDQDVRRIGRISRRDIEDVLEEIRHQRSATSSQSLLVIRCCGNLVPEELPEVRTALVQEIWKTLNTLNVPMDISHYNALLRVYLENEHQFSPTDFLAELEAKGIEPNRVTYQRLIARYCQQGDIEGATRILEYMREKELPVNENVFNALIVGHSQANDMESAAGIISVMKQASLEPSADTYTTLLCCYARHGDMDGITKTLDECEKNEVYLLDKDLLDVVYALTIHGHSDKVDSILSQIRKTVGYNQDAVNVILRLTNKGYEDVAFKILKTMPRGTKMDGSAAETGNFFIRQLVKANRPVEKIVNICKELEAEGLNSKATLIATETSLTNGTAHSALPLLRELKEAGKPVRQHYFWPLFCSAKSTEIFDVLRQMIEEFGISPNNETVRDYVVPNLKEKDVDKVVTVLRSVGVSPTNSCTALAYNALQENKLKEAAEIVSAYRAYYAPSLFRKLLPTALGKTYDYDSYIKFVRHMYDNIPRLDRMRQAQGEDEEVDPGVEAPSEISTEAQHINQAEVLGQIIYDAVLYFKTNRVEVIEKILSGLVEQGLSVSNAQAERIQDRIGSEMTITISELLGKLSAGELEPIPIERTERSRRGLDTLSIDELERFIENLAAKGENTNGLKRQLISSCFKTKDLQKTVEILDKLEQEGFVLTTGIYAQLIDLYCQHDQLDSALQVYEKLKAKEPDVTIDNLKSVKIATLMVQANRIEEAINFLEANKKEEPKTDGSFNYNTTCWRLLNYLAESGNAADLQRVFDILLIGNYVEVNNILLGPLVKVHITNNDLQKAMETFEEICNKYQSTPWKNELACRLIQTEDAENLQKLTDLSTNIHGEVNSLYDLVFCFVECGRIRQARKILETPGLRSRPQRINSVCERYRQEGLIQPLEGLIEVTKDLNHIDRSDIFYNLLLSYCKEDQPEKALGLWTKMQEEDIPPSELFLIKLGEYLKAKDLEVPFVIPAQLPIEPAKESRRTESLRKETDSKGLFRKALRDGDVDKAISIKKQLIQQEDGFSIHNKSSLIEALVKAERITEATKNVLECLEQKTHPLPRIFKFYLNKISTSGDVATLEEIGKLISPEVKKMVSFDNKLCHAYNVCGKAEPYLNKLKEDFDNAKTDEELQIIVEKFPRGGALGILEKHPELLEKFQEIAEKFASRGHVAPMNTLWIHHFANGNEEASKMIWDKYLTTCPRLMFQKILQTARDRQDENLVQKLIENLKTTKITEGALGNAYSCWLDVLCTKEKFDEGLNVLKKAIDDVCLENLNRTALNRLKTGVEAAGKPFLYKVPAPRAANDTSSSSSSSSSDDEKPQGDGEVPTK